MGKNDLQSALQMEEKLRLTLDALKSDICESVKNAKLLDGVTIPSGNGPMCAIVSFKRLRDGWMLTPAYYIPASQAEAVQKRLENAKTVTQLVERVAEMVETGQVKLSSNDVRRLNDNTKAALQAFIS